MRSQGRLVYAVLALPCLAAALAGPAGAQVFERPADERPQLEPFEPELPKPPPVVLPPPPQPPPGPGVATGLTVFVREVRIEGSTVYSGEKLAELARPWTGKNLDASEIRDLVDTVTRRYVDDGYVSSGAVLPDQDVADGVLVIEVIEARLVDVVAQGNRFYWTSTLRRRLEASVPAPVNVTTLQQQIQVLLQEPGIERIGGALEPGPRPGENVLALVVEERLPVAASLRVANDSPPGVGPVRGALELDAFSLAGQGDLLRGRFDFTEGLASQEIRYDLPFTGQGTTLELRYRHADSKIVEPPFEVVDIEAETTTVGIGFKHPIILDPSMQLWAGVRGERRWSETSLFGEPYSFVLGPLDGKADVSVIRFIQDWSWRSRTDVIAARSTVSWGLGVLDATENPSGIPDSRFVAWLLQAQYAHRFSAKLLGTTLLGRVDLQLSNDPLFTIEQVAVGGVRTVRGYRENLLVRDQAVIASLELRIPILRPLLRREFLQHRLEFAPFADFGHAWNVGTTPSIRTIASLGVGLRYAWRNRVEGYFYWGGQLRSVPTTGTSIQENGYHLGVTVRPF